MAGNTGKMTERQIAERGPRINLVCVFKANSPVGYVIMRGGENALRPFSGFEDQHRTVYARSYSLGYLLRIGRTLTRLP